MTSDDGVTVQRQSPEEAFGLLSNDLRVDILQALAEAGDSQRFSALREAVGERDSGKFNYHLGKHVGHLAVHEDDGYRLSLAGRKMYGAIISGAYTTDAEIDPFQFEGPCPMCGNAHLVAEYADEKAQMGCPECGQWRNEFSFPPASLDQFERDELPYAFDRWMHATVTKVIYGFCSNCGGRVDGRLERTDDGEAGSMPIRAHYHCDRCGDDMWAFPGLSLIYQPAVVEFFDEHGVDVLNEPSWHYFEDASDIDVDVDSEDPLRARVRYRLEDAELVAIIGPDVSIEDLIVS